MKPQPQLHFPIIEIFVAYELYGIWAMYAVVAIASIAATYDDYIAKKELTF